MRRIDWRDHCLWDDMVFRGRFIPKEARDRRLCYGLLPWPFAGLKQCNAMHMGYAHARSIAIFGVSDENN